MHIFNFDITQLSLTTLLSNSNIAKVFLQKKHILQ
jgi:hypothetical protein